MNLFLFCLFFCFFLSLSSFSKKLVFLLSLEIMMVLIVGMFFFMVFKNMGTTCFTSSMMFLVFMVLDSVLGISLLICSCRSTGCFYHFSYMI